MKTFKLATTITFLCFISGSVNAGNYDIEETKVQVSVANANGVKGENRTIYTIDDIDISLTKTDKVKAKNWRLKESEYAQYLYIMKYTPRGMWSPDIDPPIALGNEATTEDERMYYAHIMNGIEWDRRQKEGQFQLTGIRDIDNRLDALGFVKAKDRPKLIKGDFSKTLPGDKLILRSLFVDMDECKKDCREWVAKQMMQVSKKVQLDLYVANATSHTDSSLYKLLTIDPSKVVNGDINISRSSDMVKMYSKGWDTPFLIQRNDQKTTRKGLHKGPDLTDEETTK